MARDSSNAGQAFEKAVAAVQELLAPEATVEHDVRLPNKQEQMRQFDVVVRTNAATHPVLAVIECRDWSRRLGVPEVEAFQKKAESVGADLCLLASRRGFYQTAIDYARDEGIGLLSLLSDDPKDSGFSVGGRCYADLWRWGKAKMTLHCLDADAAVPEGWTPDEVVYQGKCVMDWFRRELSTTHVDEEEEGWLNVTVEFDKPREVDVAGQEVTVAGVSFHALRVHEKRAKWLSIEVEEGWYNFSRETMTIPPGGSWRTEAIRTDFRDWESYEGEIPPSDGRFRMVFRVHFVLLNPETEVVDLMAL